MVEIRATEAKLLLELFADTKSGRNLGAKDSRISAPNPSSKFYFFAPLFPKVDKVDKVDKVNNISSLYNINV